MELVEDHRADALELGIGRHLPQQQGFGDELDASLGGLGPLEADLVTNLTAKSAPTLLRDAPRQQTGRDTARLQHDDLALDQAKVQEHLRNPGRLTGARRGAQHDAACTAASGDQRLL